MNLVNSLIHNDKLIQNRFTEIDLINVHMALIKYEHVIAHKYEYCRNIIFTALSAYQWPYIYDQ
jgi:hypothetical protein